MTIQAGGREVEAVELREARRDALALKQTMDAIREALKGTPGEGFPCLDDAVSVLAKAWRDETAEVTRLSIERDDLLRQRNQAQRERDEANARALRERDIAEAQTRRADGAEAELQSFRESVDGLKKERDEWRATAETQVEGADAARQARNEWALRAESMAHEVSALEAEVSSLTARLEQMRGRAEEAEMELRLIRERVVMVP